MKKSDRTEWAKVIVRARKARGWTQATLAERAGVSLRTITNMENAGVDGPQEGTINGAREALGLSNVRLFEAMIGVDEQERAIGQGRAEEWTEGLSQYSSRVLLEELLRREASVAAEDASADATVHQLPQAGDDDPSDPAASLGAVASTEVGDFEPGDLEE